MAQLQWEKMQPAMARLDRLEELVAKVKEDMDKLEVQLEQAEATVDGGGGTLKQVRLLCQLWYPLIFIPGIYCAEKPAFPFRQARQRPGEFTMFFPWTVILFCQATAPSPPPAFHPLEIFQASDFFPISVVNQDTSKEDQSEDDKPV